MYILGMHLQTNSMRKTFVLFTLILLANSCMSYKVNLAFKFLGAYNDKVMLESVNRDDNKIIFIPMHHLGTVLFYKDVKIKIDSLKKAGFYFYTEEITVNRADTITIRKANKLKGVPFSKGNIGYKHYFDSLYRGKVKLKKELVDQPKYGLFGLDSINSRNVDVTYKDMISYYEKKYGELKLRPCDFKKSFYEKPDCDDKPIDKKIFQEIIIDFRNANVVKAILKDDRKKIAIIYGENHFKGIKEELLKQGFK